MTIIREYTDEKIGEYVIEYDASAEEIIIMQELATSHGFATFNQYFVALLMYLVEHPDELKRVVTEMELV